MPEEAAVVEVDGGGEALQGEVDSLLAELGEGEAAPPQKAAPASAKPEVAETVAGTPAGTPAEPEVSAAQKAHEAFKTRRANAAQLRQELERSEASRRAQEDFVAKIFEAAKQQQAAPKPAAPEEPVDLREDPEKWAAQVQAENRRLAQEVQALREGQEQRQREAEEARRRYEEQQHQLATEATTLQSDMEVWDREVGGFLTKRTPSGDVEKGIYQEWAEALEARGVAMGMRPHEIQAETDRRLRHFWELGARIERHPCLLLEDDAAALGVRSQDSSPAPSPPASPRAQQTSPASQTLAAARAAQQGGVAGSIGSGAQGPAGGMPTNIAELMAAGVSPYAVAEAFFGKGGNEEEALDRLLDLDARSGTVFARNQSGG